MIILRLHIAICDDEPIFCKEIKKKILEIRPEYETDIFFSGKELLETSAYYDMVFLDIEMPEQNGMETARIFCQ